MKNNYTLLYVHDPMCSWCYGFKPVLNKLVAKYTDVLNIQYILGGLAKDTDSVMSEDMQKNIRSNWQRIEETIHGIKFNYDFWTHCAPRRSTYPSCRAVISAKKQNINTEDTMINEIQSAYYQKAMNPSDYDTLYQLAANSGLNVKQFKIDIHSNEVNNELIKQTSLCRTIGADSFPSLYLFKNDIYYPIALDYNNAEPCIEHINSFL